MYEEPAVHFETRGDIGVFRFTESIEIYQLKYLRSFLMHTIADKKLRKVVFSMRDVPFIDSSGIGMFIHLEHVFRNSLRFRFCEVRKNVESVDRSSNLIVHFAVDLTEEDAIRELSSGPS